MAENINSFRAFLRMQTLVLLDKNGHATNRENGGEQRKGYKESKYGIAYKKG